MDALGAAARNPFTLAERLLGIVTDALDNNVPQSRPAPQRRYVAHGTPVLDLQDQLTVHVSNIRLASSFDGDAGGHIQSPRMILVDLTVTLVGSYPTGIVQQQGGKTKAIPAEIFDQATEQVYADGWVAYSAAGFGWKAWAGECTLHSVSPLQPLDPEGGAAGWQFTLTADIPHLWEAL